MYIYMIQSYDSYCSHFNPYVVAFKKEEDAEKQIELYDSIGDGHIKYGYKKVWLNETPCHHLNIKPFTGDSDHEHDDRIL